MPSLRWIWPKQRTRRSLESSSADHVATHTCLPSEFTASTAGTKSSSPDTSTAASKAPIAAYWMMSATSRVSTRFSVVYS
jgi:hypothetical protein